jgi:hypothetical protein
MMSPYDRDRAPQPLDRRSALRRLGALVLGLGLSGCSRGFVLGLLYPEVDGLDPGAQNRLLTAFAITVVPGFEAPERVAGLLQDPTLPFADFHDALAADLTRRTRSHSGHTAFDRLAQPQRTAIVTDGLEAGGIPARIYHAAVLFTQAAVYGGLASDDGSCSITGFEGPFRFRGYAAQTYPDPERFLPVPASADGNPW